MIQCYRGSLYGDNRIFADALPQVGETISHRDYGEVRVIALYHSFTDNYIEVQLSDGHKLTSRFSVVEVPNVGHQKEK